MLKTAFPCYGADFPCNCKAQEAAQRISEAAACQSNCFKIRETDDTGVQKIVLSAFTGSYVYHNSFLPVIYMEMAEANGITQVRVLFELKKAVKIVMAAFSVIALLLEILLAVYWALNRLAAPALLFFPLGMLVYIWAMGRIGLYFSSKRVLKTLFLALTGEDSGRAPAVLMLQGIRSLRRLDGNSYEHDIGD